MKTVIVSAHGDLAPSLLQSAAMICGENDCIHAVSFQPNEGLDDLIAKYEQIIANQSAESVLFMVDLFGGSPYNAAIRVAADKENYDVVTGVNLPMLIEVSMEMEGCGDVPTLVDTALSTALSSVKTYSGKSLEDGDYKSEEAAQEVSEQDRNRPTEGNMTISLLRIDSRLIHGQVATSWVKSLHCDAIFAISDEAASDEMRASLILQVAPPHVLSYVISVDKAIKVWHNPKYADRNVLWLVTNPNDIVRLIEGGVDIKKVNVGGMTYRQGCKMLSKSVAVDENDVDAFKKLHEMGVDMTIQQLASHAPEDLVSKLDTINFEE